MEHVIQTTADGSPTLFVPALDEHYHSVKGALTESLHVFIDKGFRACVPAAPRVLEVGFGTGLNAWLTWEEAERSRRPVLYTTLELYPLRTDEALALGYEGGAERLRALHEAAWEADVPLSPCFTLRKCRADFATLRLPADAFDLVYFDAFAPDKQPALWTEERFSALFSALSLGGILTTYCAKGEVRRRMQRAGFCVERLPGPPGGKREILRARKPV